MARSRRLSGFPEWLPDGRIVEAHVIDHLRHVFELHSFAGIETRAVEPLDALLAKGETSKEVYVIGRLADLGDAPGGDRATKLGLHFDLTVPLARYVSDNAAALTFPFKRYQIQKVWRGERPQEGRFREFTQADIDVIGRGTLPFHYELELPLLMAEALNGLDLGRVRIAANNRKVSEGFYRGLGMDDIDEVLRWIDKLDKIGRSAVAEGLVAAGVSPGQAAACLDLASIHGDDGEVTGRVERLADRLGIGSPLLDEGLGELAALVDGAREAMPGVVTADLTVARGLDYYTGSVYETTLKGHEGLGSICSGGRYDNLVGDGSGKYPGVGLSVGVSRLVSRVLGNVGATRVVPAAVWVAVVAESSRSQSNAVARALRARGIPADVSPNAAKFGRQIKDADGRGVPFVWFPAIADEGDQVKDIRSGAQVIADAETWQVPDEDRWPRVRRTDQLESGSDTDDGAAR
ncbi:MAG: histidine--tRNA ligase [Bifidobacteriaceae bacterium]|jgi:histidyl-tRNA synthetase|nr:histidine--tRNA ligase [Bifidobacteriaceae bacterium]